jgi:hypothetical protein
VGKQGAFRARFSKAWADSKGYLAAVFGVAVVALIVLVVIQAVAIRRSYTEIPWGSVSEGFGAVGTVLAVAVALWQSVVIRRQANEDAIAAAKRFQDEVDAANARTVQEVDAAERRSQVELAAAAERHKVELDAQRELARIQREHLQEQEFKRALIRVSRAASLYTQELATLVSETNRVVGLSTRQERDDALKPVSRRLGALVVDLGMEITGAGMFTNSDELRKALDRVTEQALAGPVAEIDFRNTATMAGQTPNQAPIFMVMDRLPRVIGEVRALAAKLLVTGWK